MGSGFRIGGGSSELIQFGDKPEDPFRFEFPLIEFPEEPGPLVDEDETRRLAQRRRSLEARRVGRRALRIDRPIRNPGLGIGAGAGLRIPGT